MYMVCCECGSNSRKLFANLNLRDDKRVIYFFYFITNIKREKRKTRGARIRASSCSLEN